MSKEYIYLIKGKQLKKLNEVIAKVKAIDADAIGVTDDEIKHDVISNIIDVGLERLDSVFEARITGIVEKLVEINDLYKKDKK